MRRDLPDIVGAISMLPEVEELSMVTNASLLSSSLSRELKRKGLWRVNINLPSIDSDTYKRLTGADVSNAISGVKSCRMAGVFPIKINMIVLAGENDEQIGSMILFSKKMNATLQIIELEPLQVSDDYFKRYHLDLGDIENKVSKEAKSVRVRSSMQQRRVYSLDGVDVEFVRPVENTEFCLHCTRMRLTSDGKIKPCLMRKDGLVDLLTRLRSGATDADLEDAIVEAIKQRRPFYESSLPSCQ